MWRPTDAASFVFRLAPCRADADRAGIVYTGRSIDFAQRATSAWMVEASGHADLFAGLRERAEIGRAHV